MRRPFWFPAWSPRVRLPLVGRWIIMNVSKHSISFSLKIGHWLSINTRGTYFINGPGPLDFRGKWRESRAARRPANPAQPTREPDDERW